MRTIFYLQAFVLLLTALPALSQNDTVPNELDVTDTLDQDFGLFTNDEVFNLSLRFDMTEYQRKKPKENYMDAVLTYHLNGDSINKDIRLKSRGEMRNGYCNFPPIRLNFKNAEFEKADIKSIEKLKLVTHCKYGNEDYLFKEYLIYKLYNVLTDSSFRVRLVRIEYIDTNEKKKKHKTIQTYAFFIEPIEILAKRIGATEVNSTTLSQRNIDPEMMDRMAIFNYMIGNTDWSVPNQHNCKILASLTFSAKSQGLIVPYDFDYSGLVDADYAIPYEELGLESVRDRRYVGICRSEETYKNALVEFSDKKEEFYKVINDFSLLEDKEKTKMIQYLDSFYAGMDKRNSLIYNILSGCSKL